MQVAKRDKFPPIGYTRSTYNDTVGHDPVDEDRLKAVKWYWQDGRSESVYERREGPRDVWIKDTIEIEESVHAWRLECSNSGFGAMSTLDTHAKRAKMIHDA